MALSKVLIYIDQDMQCSTFGVEEAIELLAQLRVADALGEEALLLVQLLGAEVLCRACVPVVVVQKRDEGSIRGLGE